MHNKTVCGVLVEPRDTDKIVLLIDNFRKVLGKQVPLYFFCGQSVFEKYASLYANDNKLTIINLGVDNLTVNDHNDLWKTLSFWDNFHEDYVLTIQIDGCLCENSTFTVQDFLQYDYVGGYTPLKWWWKETQGFHKYSDYQCFNGGFSLRRVAAMKHVLQSFPPQSSRPFSSNLPFESYGEDLYFVVGLLKLNKHSQVGLDEHAINFCTHTHYVRNTFCVHKLDNYVNKTELNQFLAYCPTFSHFLGS